MKSFFLIIVFIALFVYVAPKPSQLHFRNAIQKPAREVKANISPRIRGGDLADPHSIPYQVLLELHARNGPILRYCGASLISQNYVLTSAWCVDGAAKINITIGAHFLYRNEVGRINLVGEEVIIHENYNSDNFNNDIAVIKLPVTIQYSDTVKPVLLPKKSDADTNYQGVIARVSGWGSEDFATFDLFEVIRYTFVEIMDNHEKECQDLLLAGDTELSSRILCTSGMYEGEIAGPGDYDEGGPLILNGVLIGIVSYGYIYWFGGEPGAHTRVASYLYWIEANTDAIIN